MPSWSKLCQGGPKMLYHDVPYVEFIAQSKYIVTFYVLSPKRTRTSQTVRANSTSDARNLIYAQYGKENVQIISVKKD